MIEKRLRRERLARREVEEIAERTTRALYDKQQELVLLEAVVASSNASSTVEDALQGAVDAVCAHIELARGARVCARALHGGPRAEHDLAHRAVESVCGLSPGDRANDILRGDRSSGPRARHGRGGMDHRCDDRSELRQTGPWSSRSLRVPDPRGWRDDGRSGVLHRGGRRTRPRPARGDGSDRPAPWTRGRANPRAGADRSPGDARRPHRAGEPTPLPRSSRACAGARRAPRLVRCPPVPRSRPVQGRQRHRSGTAPGTSS